MIGIWTNTTDNYTNTSVRKIYKSNGEYYIDTVPIFLSRMSKRSVIFDVAKLLSWGTPLELQEYEMWQSVFTEGKEIPENAYTEKEYLYWKEIFSQMIVP